MKQTRSYTLLLFLATLAFITGISESAAQVTGLSGWNIYIDPGHSRTENQGVFGYSEAEKNVRVGLALRDMLLETTDIDTVYISRTNDQQSVGLSQRSDQANALGAAWYHSIHSDAGSPLANRTLMLWGQLKNGNEKNPPGGKGMSDIMVDVLSRGMRLSTSGSWGDCDFYGCTTGPYLSVNRRTTMPSELSEAGFHTSPVQNTRNMNAEWKRLEARTFYWSILGYHGITRPSERHVAGYVTDIETTRPVNGAVITLGDSSYTTDTFESLFDKYSNDPDQLRNGFFLFEDVPGGTLSFSVNADGYRQYTADITPVDTFFTFHDVELIPVAPPQVVETMPLPDSTHRVIDPVIIDFTRVMDRESVESAFVLQPAVTGRFVWKEDDFQLVFIPDSLESLTDYTLTIQDSAVGIFGDGLDGDGDGASGGDFVLTFSTGLPDVFAPAIVGSYPRVNARSVERDPIITLTYSERIDSTSVTGDMATLEPTAGGPSVPGLLKQYDEEGRSLLSFFPESFLDADKTYRFTIAPGIRDEFGNEETSSKQIFFKTGLLVHDRDLIDDFDSGLDPWWVPQQSGSTDGIVTDSTAREVDSLIVNHLTGSSKSMRLDYGWATPANDWLIRVFLGGGAPRNVLFDSTYVLEAYVYGDGSGNLFRFAVDDRVPASAASNHEVSPWFTIDWYGWRLVSWNPGRDGTGTWLGDGSLDGTLRFDSIQLSHKPDSPEFGTFYVDDLRISKIATNTASETVTELPDQFIMHQNYPNPFNPVTTLRFDLSTSGLISLKIYNVLGAEVATLANQTFLAGTHEVKWDAGRMTSGVYFARLTSGQKSQTVKLLLLK